MSSRLMNKRLHNQLGFTLLELLVVIAVIGVLASLAVPRLQNQIQRARFVEVVNSTSPYKTAVESCLQIEDDAATCDAGGHGIPADTTTASGNVASVVVSNGVITATAQGAAGTDTYILTPTIIAAGGTNGVTWSDATGSCKGTGLC